MVMKRKKLNLNIVHLEEHIQLNVHLKELYQIYKENGLRMKMSIIEMKFQNI